MVKYLVYFVSLIITYRVERKPGMEWNVRSNDMKVGKVTQPVPAQLVDTTYSWTI